MSSRAFAQETKASKDSQGSDALNMASYKSFTSDTPILLMRLTLAGRQLFEIEVQGRAP